MLPPVRSAPLRARLAASLLGLAALAPAAGAQETVTRRPPDVPFVPTPPEVVDAMLRLAGVTSSDLVYDLGCGDGRIVIAAAKRYGARGVGVDIDPERIRSARANADSAGVSGRVRFLEQDLFQTDIRPATVVTLYLLPSVNEKLRPTLLRTLRPGTRVVSHAFDMGDWQPDAHLEVGGRNVYFWLIPADVQGEWTWETRGPEGPERYSARLEQKYQQVTGRVAAGRDTVPITRLRLAGDSLTLAFARAGQEMEYRGRVSGDAIRGVVTIGTAPGGGQPWSARRIRRTARARADSAARP